MSTRLMDAIVRDLPPMRRYARALSADRRTGDRLVRAALEQVLRGPEPPDPEAARLAFYRAVTRACSDPALPAEGGGLFRDAAILARGVARLPGPRRQILILATLEGLTTDQIATVMEMDEREVIRELVAARRELREQPPSRVLIIEDEPLVALDLQQTVEAAGHEVTGVATTHRAAVQLARAEPPGVLLADIHLADASSGLAAVAEIQTACRAPAIFITGFPELVLERERPEAACVISKPFDPEMLGVALAQSLRGLPG